MFYIYLRVNGIKRLIDLAYFHLGVPLLEPVREVIAKFILSPLRRKIMITATLVVIGLFFLVIFHLWMLMSILLSVLIILAFSVIFYLGVRPIYRFQYWRAHRDRLLEFRPSSYVISIDNLGLSPQELINLREQVGVHREIIIADIDQDGYLLSQFGPFAGAQTILAKDFISRKRNDLQVVAVGENVGVKKTFTNNRKGFLSELEVLNTLWGRSNVPAILNLDFDNLSIVFSFIPGVVIREELAKRGAKIRHRDLDNDQQYQGLPRGERKDRRIESARQALNDYVGHDLKEEIFSELMRIHRHGVLVNDVKYGNIIIERDSGKPFFIDFDFAQKFGYPRSIQGEVRRDIEIETFNLIFDSNKPTRKRILKEMDQISMLALERQDVSVIFGHGLAMGRTWDVSYGEGLWHYLVEPNIPDLEGMRIFDLAHQDPLFSLRMLLKGASEIVRVEPDEQWRSYTRFLKEGFEWSHSLTLNLDIVKSKLEELSILTLGTFNFVFTQESVFNLPKIEVENLSKQLSTISDKVIIDCMKMPYDSPAENPTETPFVNIISPLESCGFHLANVFSPVGCGRQLIIVEQ